MGALCVRCSRCAGAGVFTVSRARSSYRFRCCCRAGRCSGRPAAARLLCCCGSWRCRAAHPGPAAARTRCCDRHGRVLGAAALTSAASGAASTHTQQAAASQSGQLQLQLSAGSQLLPAGGEPHANAHALSLQQSQECGFAAQIIPDSPSAELASPGQPPEPSQGSRQGQVAPEEEPQARPGGVGRVLALWLYPIKSCAALAVTEWPLGPNGLLLDREWALVDELGHVSFMLFLDGPGSMH